MSKNNPAGSTWAKWDLHVHTPSSIIQNYGGNDDQTWDTFIEDLETLPTEFKVIGINDYIFVDGYARVLNAKDKGRLRNIDLILPVVELRLDKFAGVVKKGEDGTYSKSDWNRVNLHVIFDQLDPEVIRQQFLSALVQCYHLIPEAIHHRDKWQAVITPASLTQLGQMIIDSAPANKKSDYGSPFQEGFNNLCVGLESVLDTLDRHDLKDHYLLAVGKTEWENMKWDDHSIAEKRNVINCVDLVFTAAEHPQACEKARKKLSEANVLDTLLDCSDAHALSNSQHKDRIGNCFTWIKADPTFQGLVQAVTEFDQRVFVGDMPPKILHVKGNRTKYVSSISIKKRTVSDLPDDWFDIEVPLNHDLVAIIGNKGSGKSALADVIALIGDTRNYESFSFLSEARFRDPRNNLAESFTGTLRWQDGMEAHKDLHDNPAPSSVERIKYLPQNYLENLCNELEDSGSPSFDGELRKIIYTHVPDEQRIGFQSLDELLNFQISELEKKRKQLINDLSNVNAELVSIEHKLTPEYKESLQKQLEVKQKEFAALEEAKPVVVEDPLQSEDAKQETATATDVLAKLEATLNEIRIEEQTARQQKANALKGAAHAMRVLQALRNHEENHKRFINDLDAMLGEVASGLNAAEIVSLTINFELIEQQRTRFQEEADAQDRILLDKGEEGLSRRREVTESKIQTIKDQLSERQRLFLLYKEQLAHWEQAKAELKGEKNKINTIAWYTAELSSVKGLPERRNGLIETRRRVVCRIHEQIGKVVDEYRKLYQPVQSFVQSTAHLEMSLPLSFDVRIVEEGFQDSFLNRINRTRGSFMGVDESNQLVRRMLKETDFMDPNAVVALVDKIDDMLHYDRRLKDSKAEVSVLEQLRKGNRPEELYNFLFGLEYLKPQYSLTYDQHEITRLSPGERGLLLLVFYLLVDKDDIPLVIDQPEENLDNQTIYKILVRCIKAAKQRRQVIIVTHNPNLAVVCDAEQIIFAACDKAMKRFSYVSGAIESPEIKAQVIEILEGTKPAFQNRSRKYNL